MSELTSSVVVHKDGIDHLFMTGNNAYGQQGNGKEGNSIRSFTEVNIGENGLTNSDIIKQVSMSSNTSSIVTQSNDNQYYLYM